MILLLKSLCTPLADYFSCFTCEHPDVFHDLSTLKLKRREGLFLCVALLQKRHLKSPASLS